MGCINVCLLICFITYVGNKQCTESDMITSSSLAVHVFFGRMTLLLGPPGCGKTTMLLALSGKLSHSLKVLLLL
jgi:ABC-type Fe3+/spermidine/putrescine transport system ATPase subunit